jgi:hypothetical protein
MISSKRPALGPLGSRLKIGTNNTWNLSLSPAQSALLEPGATFRIASGGETGSSEYTVEDNNGSGEIRFSAPSRDAYAAADKITLVSNGDLSLLPLSFTLNTSLSNSITVTAAQADDKLAIGDKFKLWDGSTLRDSENTITDIYPDADPANSIIEFEAADADTIDPGDTIMVATDISIGEGNLQGGSFASGSGQKLYLDPDLADLLSAGDTFRIAAGSADGDLKTPVNKVTGVSGGEVTFTADAANSYAAGDYIVFPVNYADLKGAVSWDHSMAQGADKAVNQPDPAFYSASGLTAADVFTGTRYSPKTSGPLYNTGDDTLYPVYAADLETQCFERFEAYVDPPPPALAGIKNAINTLLGTRLYTWSGSPSTGALSGPRNIADFLARDNGSNKGDLRDTSIPSYLVYPSKPRKSGIFIDLGAYEN